MAVSVALVPLLACDFNFGQISIAISALDHDLSESWVKHELIGKLGVSLEQNILAGCLCGISIAIDTISYKEKRNNDGNCTDNLSSCRSLR